MAAGARLGHPQVWLNKMLPGFQIACHVPDMRSTGCRTDASMCSLLVWNTPPPTTLSFANIDGCHV